MIDSTNLRLKVTCTTHGVVLVHGDDSWVRTLADGSLQFWSICPVGPHRMRQAPSAEEVAALVAEGVTVADAEASTVLTRIANEPHATVADTAAACITDKTKLRRVVSDAYGCAILRVDTGGTDAYAVAVDDLERKLYAARRRYAGGPLQQRRPGGTS